MEVAVRDLKCEGVVACGSFSVKQLRCVGVTVQKNNYFKNLLWLASSISSRSLKRHTPFFL